MSVRSRRAPIWLGYLAGILTLFAACVHSAAAPLAEATGEGRMPLRLP